MSSAYEAGKQAKRDGKSSQENPYRGEPNKVGIRRYTDEQAGSDWARGHRDQCDAMAKQFPDASSFRRKSNRFYS